MRRQQTIGGKAYRGKLRRALGVGVDLFPIQRAGRFHDGIVLVIADSLQLRGNLRAGGELELYRRDLDPGQHRFAAHRVEGGPTGGTVLMHGHDPNAVLRGSFLGNEHSSHRRVNGDAGIIVGQQPLHRLACHNGTELIQHLCREGCSGLAASGRHGNVSFSISTAHLNGGGLCRFLGDLYLLGIGNTCGTAFQGDGGSAGQGEQTGLAMNAGRGALLRSHGPHRVPGGGHFLAVLVVIFGV